VALPNEVWGLIFEVLDDPGPVAASKSYTGSDKSTKIDQDTVSQADAAATRDFWAVSLVSRRLHDIVEPYLYNKFSWVPSISDPDPSLDQSNQFENRRKNRVYFPLACSPPPYLLLRTLLRRPELVHYFTTTKTFSAAPGIDLFGVTFKTREGVFTTKELEVCKNLIQKLPGACQQKWRDGLDGGKLDVVMGLLFLELSRSKRFETIDIRVGDCCATGCSLFDALTISKEIQEIPRFSAVTCINLSADREESGSTYPPMINSGYIQVDEQVQNLFKFPQLKTLALHFCWGYTGSLSIATHLRKLTLTHSYMLEEELADLFNYTPLLEDLEFSLVSDRSAGESVDFEVINGYLSVVRKTLKRLTITIGIEQPDYRDDGDGPWDVENTIDSMKHFKKLE
jgi:hypothetical protein